MWGGVRFACSYGNPLPREYVMCKLQSIAIMAGVIGLFAFFACKLRVWVGALLVVGPGLLFNGLSLGRLTGLIVHLHRARPLSCWEVR